MPPRDATAGCAALSGRQRHQEIDAVTRPTTQRDCDGVGGHKRGKRQQAVMWRTKTRRKRRTSSPGPDEASSPGPDEALHPLREETASSPARTRQVAEATVNNGSKRP